METNFLIESGQEEPGSSITLQNKLDALRDTERGLVAHNCFIQCRKSELTLSLLTIMVSLNLPPRCMT